MKYGDKKNYVYCTTKRLAMSKLEGVMYTWSRSSEILNIIIIDVIY